MAGVAASCPIYILQIGYETLPKDARTAWLDVMFPNKSPVQDVCGVYTLARKPQFIDNKDVNRPFAMAAAIPLSRSLWSDEGRSSCGSGAKTDARQGHVYYSRQAKYRDDISLYEDL